jgi:hypothetical protein
MAGRRRARALLERHSPSLDPPTLSMDPQHPSLDPCLANLCIQDLWLENYQRMSEGEREKGRKGGRSSKEQMGRREGGKGRRKEEEREEGKHNALPSTSLTSSSAHCLVQPRAHTPRTPVCPLDHPHGVHAQLQPALGHAEFLDQQRPHRRQVPLQLHLARHLARHPSPPGAFVCDTNTNPAANTTPALSTVTLTQPAHTSALSALPSASLGKISAAVAPGGRREYMRVALAALSSSSTLLPLPSRVLPASLRLLRLLPPLSLIMIPLPLSLHGSSNPLPGSQTSPWIQRFLQIFASTISG